MWQSVLLKFILASLVFVSRNMIFFSSQTQIFQKNWRLITLLSISELLVKSIWQYYCQCRISLELGKNIGSSIISQNYVPVKSKLQHPPPGNPRAFEFLECFCSNSPLTGPKSCSNAPTPGKLTRLLF